MSPPARRVFLTNHSFYRVSVTLSGNGVVSGLGTFGCAHGSEDDCATVAENQTMLDLVPKAFPGFHFTGWTGGGCTGTSDCSLVANPGRGRRSRGRDG